jgi:cellulose synthase/poly-beta-1,6-N-acetylglucosamine synthase-like glycosyltransferase
MYPSVTIIIAAKAKNKYLEGCIQHCLELDYPFYEIIILPDENFDIAMDKRIKIIPTGSVLPAAKRDMGAAEAQGEILAFLDDDTYPTRDWLRQAVLGFRDGETACVCGPAVTPDNDLLLSKASGKVYESVVVSGPARFRYVPLKKRYCDDFPSCNFLIRKDVFQLIGGFNTKFWPGEDTILCLEVVHKLKKKILYDPLVLVYHYRRPLFRGHLIQVANYAKHRGYFIKRYPRNSFKPGYFGPSAILIALFTSLILGAFLDNRFFYIIISYLVLVLMFSIQSKLKLIFLVFLGIILTHQTYGLNFIKGILSRKLEEEL